MKVDRNRIAVRTARACEARTCIVAFLLCYLWSGGASSARDARSVVSQSDLVLHCADRNVSIATVDERNVWLEIDGKRFPARAEPRTVGIFRINAPPAGAAALFVEDPNYAPVRVDVMLRGVEQHEQLTLNGVHQIHLQITESTVGVPVLPREVAVRLVDAEWFPPAPIGPQGHFTTRFPVRFFESDGHLALPSGRYLIEVAAEGFATCFVPVDLSARDPGDIAAKAQLRLPGCVVGRVNGIPANSGGAIELFRPGDEQLPSVGSFVDGVRASGRSAGRGRELARAEVGSDGSFVVASLDSGEYAVKLRLRDGDESAFQASGSLSNSTLTAARIVVTAGAATVINFDRR
jgi:hypothetical protein